MHSKYLQWIQKPDDGIKWDESFAYDTLVMGIAEKNLKDRPETYKSETNLAYLNWTKIN